MSHNKGLDIGTNMIVAAINDGVGNPEFERQRDAFYRIVPKTDVHRNSVKMSLDKRGAKYITDADGSFLVIGEDALQIAIERNDKIQRPMSKGVVSPKEKASLPMLKLIIDSLIGKGSPGDRCFYSVPGNPVDADFDIEYHTEMLGYHLRQNGYFAKSVNEAYAVGLSELLDDGLTGVAMSFGAGMSNTAVIHEGDSLIEFSLTRGGDYIDNAVGHALDVPPSFVQAEKEAGTDLYNPTTKIMEALAVYYSSVVNYTLRHMSDELKQRKSKLPRFRHPVPIIVSGGLTLAVGFEKKVTEAISTMDFPLEISEVRRAVDPMTAVANGCMLAASI